MRVVLYISWLIFVFSFSTSANAQANGNFKDIYSGGITFESGLGNYSVRDEYISEEKYSGTLPYYRVGWSRAHDKYIYNLDMEFRYSSAIENYNVSTEIYQFAFDQGFLYPFTKRSLFSKDIYIYLGPGSEFYFFYNKPDIAVSGYDYAQSSAALFAAAVNAEIIYPLNDYFLIESSCKVDVLSLGFRLVDMEEEDENTVKILTLFSGTNLSYSLGGRYRVIDQLSFELAYRMELTRISAWQPLLSASDNIILGVRYEF